MAVYDKDVLSARLEDELAENRTLYITLHNKPTVENKCTITRLVKPRSDISPKYTGFHYKFAIFLAELSFQYSAELVDVKENDEEAEEQEANSGENDQKQKVRLTIATEIAGLLSGVYGHVLKTMVKEGCDHMAKSVPDLAATLSSLPADEEG